jgi:hypothetical protein
MTDQNNSYHCYITHLELILAELCAIWALHQHIQDDAHITVPATKAHNKT